MNFQDFVTVELPLRPFVSTDGIAGQTLVRSTNPLAPRELVWADVGTGASAYDLAVSLGFQGTEAEWIASLKGDQGKSAYEIAVDHGFVGTELQWLLSLKGADGGGTSIVYQTPLVGVSVSSTVLIDSLDYTLYAQAAWDVLIQTASKVRRYTVAALINKITNAVYFTTYGIIGNPIANKVHMSYDSGTSQLKLSIENSGAEEFVVSALRYPVRSS